MPDTLQSLADSVKINDVSVRDLGARDIFNDALFLDQLCFTKATNGTVHKYLKEATAPTVGFRAANAGLDVVVGSDTLVTVDLKYMDATVRLDKALADVGKGREYQLDRQGRRNLRQAMFILEDQVFNGSSGSGFSGFAQALNALANSMVLNAAGAANRTSVYMVRTTPEETDVMLVGGNEGNIQMGQYYEALINEAATGRQFNGFVMPIEGWFTIQVGGSKSIARLANVGTTAGTTVSDDWLSQLFDLFPASAPPTHIVMNRRSRGQLQRSRATINVGGKALVQTAVPIPTDWNGIPIVCVETIGNAEAAVA
jgi:hypothetical protein